MSGRDPRAPGSRLAIVGTGIAGLVAAHRLHGRHDLTVYEADDRIGGHTHTVEVDVDGHSLRVDTGFIVFNDKTYPNFTRLLGDLGVPSKPTTMSFSVHCERSGLEYQGSSLGGLFAQPSNLLRPSFLRMLREILRFNRVALARLPGLDDLTTLGEFLAAEGFTGRVVDQYVVPMGAAIWSSPPQRMLAFPAATFVRFLANHGMLSLRDRPQWRVVEGGSRTYLDRITAPFRDRILVATPVLGIERSSDGVTILSHRGLERFDGVIVAAHSNQALALLRDPTRAERDVLGNIPYQRNDVLLHTDARVLPQRRRAWAAWNYRIPRGPRALVAVSYAMQILQGLDTPIPVCVTLNDDGTVREDKILKRMVYHHPVFTTDALRAQGRRAEISGVDRTWFCGAYWRYGFHEDGVVSALELLRDFGDAAGEAA